jgi:hypothetical protein
MPFPKACHSRPRWWTRVNCGGNPLIVFILDKDIFREDQIWFTDKDRFGATDLYSLADFELPQEFNLVKFYLNGKFGAIPSIKNFITNINSN